MLIVDISHTSYCNFADDINGHYTCRWCDDLSIKMNNTSAPKASCKTKTGLMKVSFHEFTLLNLWCLKGTKNIEPLKSKTNQMFTTFKFMSHANISPSVWHILLWREKLFNWKSLDLPQNCFQVNPCEAAVMSTGFWTMMLVFGSFVPVHHHRVLNQMIRM